MTTLRALKTLLLGETWLLPLGVAAIIAAADLVVRPLAPVAWRHLGGFLLLAAIAALLAAGVARTARPRP
jgi:hypothetical protein